MANRPIQMAFRVDNGNATVILNPENPDPQQSCPRCIKQGNASVNSAYARKIHANSYPASGTKRNRAIMENDDNINTSNFPNQTNNPESRLFMRAGNRPVDYNYDINNWKPGTPKPQAMDFE